MRYLRKCMSQREMDTGNRVFTSLPSEASFFSDFQTRGLTFFNFFTSQICFLSYSEFSDYLQRVTTFDRQVRRSSCYTFLKSSHCVENDKTISVEKYGIVWQHGAMQDNTGKIDPLKIMGIDNKCSIFHLFTQRGIHFPLICKY